ncbi:MAG: hypothetical protein EZS28_046174, partial [Streblomastix strix]
QQSICDVIEKRPCSEQKKIHEQNQQQCYDEFVIGKDLQIIAIY